MQIQGAFSDPNIFREASTRNVQGGWVGDRADVVVLSILGGPSGHSFEVLLHVSLIYRTVC